MNKKILIPVLLGVSGLIFLFKDKIFGKKGDEKEPKKESEPSPTPTPKPTPTQTPTDAFPLKYGSKGNNVKLLQEAIGVENLGGSKIDGDFGRKTEAAVFTFLGKKTVDNKGEIDKIRTMPKNPKITLEELIKAANDIRTKLLGKPNSKVVLTRDSYVTSGVYLPSATGGTFKMSSGLALKKAGTEYAATYSSVDKTNGYVLVSDFVNKASGVSPLDIKIV